jgi:excisionase family DNA binding protein
MVSLCPGVPAMNQEQLLTVEEAIERLGVSPATFWNLVKRFELPKYKVPMRGKRVFFRPSDLDRLNQPYRVNSNEGTDDD